MKTKKRHKCANMGNEKWLELWWQLYRTSLPEQDVRNITLIDFCSTECTKMMRHENFIISSWWVCHVESFQDTMNCTEFWQDWDGVSKIMHLSHIPTTMTVWMQKLPCCCYHSPWMLSLCQCSADWYYCLHHLLELPSFAVLSYQSHEDFVR